MTYFDNWRSEEQNKSLGSDWTGMTTFYMRDAITPILSSTPSQKQSSQEWQRPEREEVNSQHPYSGDLPPRILDPTAKHLYHRRADGVWTKRNAAGQLQPVDILGNRFQKKKDKKWTHKQRPPEITAIEWETATEAEKRKYWRENPPQQLPRDSSRKSQQEGDAESQQEDQSDQGKEIHRR